MVLCHSKIGHHMINDIFTCFTSFLYFFYTGKPSCFEKSLQQNNQVRYRLLKTARNHLQSGKLNVELQETCLKWTLKKKTKIGFQDGLSLNAGQKCCRILEYFGPSLSYHLSLRPLFSLFLVVA